MNPNRKIRVEKVTLNIGAGKDQAMIEKGLKLLESLTGAKPVKTITMKRIASWGLRPRLPIGCKVTLRGEKARALLSRLLGAKEHRLSRNQIDTQGNVSFGIHEYIDIPDAKYDPDIGIIGLEVSVTFERPGYRIKRRREKRRKVPSRHRITKEEVVEVLSKEFNVRFEEDSE